MSPYLNKKAKVARQRQRRAQTRAAKKIVTTVTTTNVVENISEGDSPQERIQQAHAVLAVMPESARVVFIEDAGMRLSGLFHERLAPAVRPRYALAAVNCVVRGDVEVLAALASPEVQRALVKPLA